MHLRIQRRLLLLTIMPNAFAVTAGATSTTIKIRPWTCVVAFHSRTRTMYRRTVHPESIGDYFSSGKRIHSVLFSSFGRGTSLQSPTIQSSHTHRQSTQHNMSSYPPMQSRTEFIHQITSFLEEESIPYRPLTNDEMHHILNSYLPSSTNSRDELHSILAHRNIYLVGPEHSFNLQSTNALFILHLCPTLTLDDIQTMLGNDSTASSSLDTNTISDSVARYAWMNAHLTNALTSYFNKSNETNELLGYNHSNQEQQQQQQHKAPPIVHLHQDIYNQNPTIVQSRLKSKVALHKQRIYGRQCFVARISKLEYLPFLEANHLWGGTGAKSAFGLFEKSKRKSTTNTTSTKAKTANIKESGDPSKLVAVATFSPKRKVSRAGSIYQSYELLRFCTQLDTTVVGGLTKLISAFVKEIPQTKKLHKNTDPSDSGTDDFGIDIITSIDRDFGCSTWPQFEIMDVMDPVPMFIGEDGIRRHAVGAGLIPLDQNEAESLDLGTSALLRAGLPQKLRDDLHQRQFVEGGDSPWEIAAEKGFHPVFDAGVERLMYIARKPSCQKQSTDSTRVNTKIDESNDDLTLEEMWEQSVPRFVTKHYSPNHGLDWMLRCIQEKRLF